MDDSVQTRVEQESDSELDALRKELLSGLTKKCEKKRVDHLNEDEELNQLRNEALNAKRNRDLRNQETGTKPYSKPSLGRFRYDNDNGDDDEEDFNSYNELNELVYEQGESHNSQIPHIYNEAANQYGQEQHNNYLTYRDECSKLIPNDAYDPKGLYEPAYSMPDDFDLRNFLRNKASQHQHEPVNDAENATNEIVYTEPITKPIEVQRDYYMKRPRQNKNYNRYLNESFVARKANEYNDSLKAHKNLSNSESDGEESDDDQFLKSKKIKSIVIVKKPDKIAERTSSHSYSKKEEPELRDSINQRFSSHSSHEKRKSKVPN